MGEAIRNMQTRVQEHINIYIYLHAMSEMPAAWAIDKRIHHNSLFSVNLLIVELWHFQITSLSFIRTERIHSNVN